MTEQEAVEQGLKLCGFADMTTSYVHENYSVQVYVPKTQCLSFRLVLEYLNYYSFHQMLNKEEKLIYYRSARRMERYRKLWNEYQEIL